LELDFTSWEVRRILLGVNLETLDIGSIEEGDIYVQFKLRNRNDDFKWILVAVYGAAQPEFLWLNLKFFSMIFNVIHHDLFPLTNLELKVQLIHLKNSLLGSSKLSFILVNVNR
jgi:hypothetical protein